MLLSIHFLQNTHTHTLSQFRFAQRSVSHSLLVSGHMEQISALLIGVSIAIYEYGDTEAV